VTGLPDRDGGLALKWLPLLLGVPLCLAAGWFELTRAQAGRMLAWVYVGEWPLYAVLGSWLWWRVWYSDAERCREPRPDIARLAEADDGLAAWQHYLTRLQDADPPGGPPEP
jgi:hypothetical protein